MDNKNHKKYQLSELGPIITLYFVRIKSLKPLYEATIGFIKNPGNPKLGLQILKNSRSGSDTP